MEVVVLKMVSGEEIVSRMVNMTNGNIELSKPRVFQMMQGQRGPQAGLIPWFITAPDETFVVSMLHVMSFVTAPHDIERAYTEQVSGISLSSSLMEG